MTRRRPARARGFTLVELMIGAAVMVVVLAGAAMVLVAAVSQHRRQLERANLERSCTLLIGQMAAELRQIGLGIPTGPSNLAGNPRLPATVLQANATDIAFLTDLPRPNSSFNGLSRLSDKQDTIGTGGVAILNELNGTCDVDSAPGHCRTDQQSALFGTGTECSSLTPNVPTCPWSLNKYQPNESIVLADGAGKWMEAQVAPGPNIFVSSAGRLILALAGTRPATFFDSAPNRGFVSAPDRVFYRLNAGTVERLQCWAPLGGTLTLASLLDPLTCGSGPNDTGWETRARNVSSLTFEYRDAADVVIPTPVAATDLRRIRRVVVQLTLQRTLGTSTVSADATASATVRM